MEEVVYFLGAGFSAPFGIPVMSKFLEESKNMFSKNPDDYKHLKRIFEKINKMDKINRFYSMDVYNIEDVLSILEMDERLGRRKLKKSYIRYIKDVIEYYTPQLESESPMLNDQDWYTRIFDSRGIHGYMPMNELQSNLGFFVSSIHNLRFQREQRGSEYIIQFNRPPDFQTHYSIITLNYDLLLENICRFINKQYRHSTNGVVTFATDTYNTENPILAKLHGSIEDTTIIPPTWNKSTTEPKIRNAWKLAYKALVEANYIRIIGYSLPPTDNYIKYLLSLAVMESFNLKKIDVICKDDSEETVKKRYESFIRFKNYRFINGNVEDYLSRNYGTCRSTVIPAVDPKEIVMNGLEEAHEAFFRG